MSPSHHPFPRPDLGPGSLDALAEFINSVIEAGDGCPTAHAHVSRAERLVAVKLNHEPDCPNVAENCEDHEASAASVFLSEHGILLWEPPSSRLLQ